MIKVSLKKQFLKKKRLLLSFFLLFSLFIVENVLAQKQWKREFVEVNWNAQMNAIVIKIIVYDYLFGPGFAHGYLQWCTIDASVNGVQYFKLMDILTMRQIFSYTTKIDFRKKSKRAQIHFLDNVVSPSVGSIWPEDKNLKVTVLNCNEYAKVSLGCFMNVRTIQVSGKWISDIHSKNFAFNDFLYEINMPTHSFSKSNAPGIITKVFKNDSVKVFKNTDSIVIKGAESGENIKVYTTSGAEIKSVVSNNEAVKIELPANQIYIVHIGKSRHKVVL